MQAGRHGITDVLLSREGQCLQEITDAAAGDRYRVHLAEAEPLLALYHEPWLCLWYVPLTPWPLLFPGKCLLSALVTTSCCEEFPWSLLGFLYMDVFNDWGHPWELGHQLLIAPCSSKAIDYQMSLCTSHSLITVTCNLGEAEYWSLSLILWDLILSGFPWLRSIEFSGGRDNSLSGATAFRKGFQKWTEEAYSLPAM